MALTEAEFFASVTSFAPPWRRSALWINKTPTLAPYDYDAFPGTTALGMPPIGAADITPEDPVRVIADRDLPGDVRGEIVSTHSWFDDVHTLPRVLDFGLVVATTERVTESYNAFRIPERSLVDWINNGGPGIDLLGESLPEPYAPQTGSADLISVEVTTEGEPVVESTLEYVWDNGAVNIVEIRITRVVPFATTRGLLVPNDDIAEFLDFYTAVYLRADGTEQRMRLRKNPRQTFEHVYAIHDEVQRSEFDNLIANSQARLFSVGVWEHEVPLTAAVAIGETTINVLTTAYSDFRVGGTLVVFVEDGPFEIRGIEAINQTSIVVASPMTQAFAAGARVVPMRSALLPAEIGGTRFPVSVAEVPIRFEVVDNDSNLGDLAGWTTFDGKIVLDDFNFDAFGAADGLARTFRDLDGEVGARYRESDEILSRQLRSKSFLTRRRADAWKLRRLIHALGGQLASWYFPTFRTDLEVTAALLSGDDKMAVSFVGYTANVQSRAPKDVIRVVLTDGSYLDRKVIGSEVLVANVTEQLQVGEAWPTDIGIEEVERVMYLQKTRFASDRIRFDHLRGGVVMRVSAPTKAVLS